MQSLVSLFVVVLMAFAEAKSIRDEPKFCHGLECPHFITVNKTDKYELRCYKEDYKWASTIVAGYEYDKAVEMGFMRLFNYIEGENVPKKKIPMTAPVAVEIQPGQGPFCKNNFTINFFVPFEDQEDPAPPTSKDVYISTLKGFCAYVKVYGGYSNIDEVQKYSEELSEELVKDGLGDSFRKDIFFYAGYDSPFRVVDRHNEIWFIKIDSVLKPSFF